MSNRILIHRGRFLERRDSIARTFLIQIVFVAAGGGIIPGCGGSDPAPEPDEGWANKGPIIQFTADAWSRNPQWERKARIGLEYRDVLFLPHRSDRMEVPVRPDGKFSVYSLIRPDVLHPLSREIDVFWESGAGTGFERVRIPRRGEILRVEVQALPPVAEREATGTEFILDGGFENLDSEEPSPWRPWHFGAKPEKLPDWDNVYRAVEDKLFPGPPGGSKRLLLVPDNDEPAGLRQELYISDNRLTGNVLTAGLDGFSTHADALVLRISDVDTGNVLAEVAHPGDGTWRTLSTQLDISRLPSPRRLEFDVLRLESSGAIVLADNASLVDPAGPTGSVRAWAQERSPEIFETAPVMIRDGDVLEFGTALYRRERAPDGTHATFTIYAEYDGARRRLFAETLSSESHAWNDHTVPLSKLAGKEVELLFETFLTQKDETQGAEIPLWASPTLLRRSPEPRSGPNLLIVSLDTLRADHLGTYGYDRNTSPNIDAFAERSIVFENCISTSSWTTPAHASLFTGMDPPVHQAGGFEARLRDQFTTIAEIATKYGYLTAAFTEGAAVSGGLGFTQGFSRYDDGVETTLFPPKTAPKTFRKASEWLKTHHSYPFFAFVHTYEIHAPYQPPEGWNKFGDGHTKRFYPSLHLLDPATRQASLDLYDGGIAYTDSVLGDWLDWLDAEGILSNTVVVLLSDHGEEFYEHGGRTHNYSLYQEVLHVPLIIRLPGENPPHGRIQAHVSLTDVFATLLDVMQAQTPADTGQSVTLAPFLDGETSPAAWNRQFVTSVWHRTDLRSFKFALQDARHKYILSADYGNFPFAALEYVLKRDDAFRGSFGRGVARYAAQQSEAADARQVTLDGGTFMLTEELYDMVEDAGELSNIAATESEGLRAARERAEKYFEYASDTSGPVTSIRSLRDKLTEEQREAFKALGYMQ